MPTREAKLLGILRKNGVIRARDLSAFDIPREYLIRLQDKGLIEKAGRGLYVATDAEPTANQSLVEACMRISHGVVCLLSALQFHELTTQAPFEVWIAVNNRWPPKVDSPPIRIVYFSGKAFTAGIEEHTIQNVPVKVYSPAKTVADCFKYRNKIGQDVAIEALRECWRERKATMDELWQMARVCRVATVIRPYMETLT